MDFGVLGNGFDHEIRSVSDVSCRSEEDRRHGDGHEDVRMAGGEGSHIGRFAKLQSLLTDRCREEREVSRSVVQQGGKHAGEGVELDRCFHAQRVRVKLQIVQCRNHCPENSEEQPCYFLDRVEVEMVHLVYLLGRVKVGPDGRRDHDDFPPRRRQEDGTEDDGDEGEVAFAVDAEFFVAGLQFPDNFRRPAEVDRVHDDKNQKQGTHRDQPRVPEVDRGPEKRDALQVAQEERRVAYRGEGATHIAYDENEKYDVECRDAVFVHPYPRADHEHRRTGGADEVGNNRPDRQIDRVTHRCGLASHADMDPAGHDEKRADQGYEAGILVAHFGQAGALAEHEEVVPAGEESEGQRDFGVIVLPPVKVDERHQGDRKQHHPERDDHQRIRFDRDGRYGCGECQHAGIPTKSGVRLKANPGGLTSGPAVPTIGLL